MIFQNEEEESKHTQVYLPHKQVKPPDPKLEIVPPTREPLSYNHYTMVDQQVHPEDHFLRPLRIWWVRLAKRKRSCRLVVGFLLLFFVTCLGVELGGEVLGECEEAWLADVEWVWVFDVFAGKVSRDELD